VSALGAAHASWNPWANDRGTLELYRRRCRREAEEMTCAAQAAEILAPLVEPGETLLDAGCGGGYYLWSLRDRGIDVEYHGLDFTPEMVGLAREEVAPAAGLDPERFRLGVQPRRRRYLLAREPDHLRREVETVVLDVDAAVAQRPQVVAAAAEIGRAHV